MKRAEEENTPRILFRQKDGEVYPANLGVKAVQEEVSKPKGLSPTHRELVGSSNGMSKKMRKTSGSSPIKATVDTPTGSHEEEHWTLINVLEKWAPDATRVCNLAWTYKRCCSWKAGSRVLEFIEAVLMLSRRDMDPRSRPRGM
ncbi:hypothetical protein H0E87_015156 [Populus deltoides]|uniref:Uncharacterized protein n=1 Tax=Populus deltoides TaxID=3696 RepID=A0A8T2Y3V4_POPDE|nr:hypothetical protein H0E87_015156 [Populus deltoides]